MGSSSEMLWSRRSRRQCGRAGTGSSPTSGTLRGGPAEVDAFDGVTSVFRVITALGMVETMRTEGHTGLVHTVGASNLGLMLNRISLDDGAPRQRRPAPRARPRSIRTFGVVRRPMVGRWQVSERDAAGKHDAGHDQRSKGDDPGMSVDHVETRHRGIHSEHALFDPVGGAALRDVQPVLLWQLQHPRDRGDRDQGERRRLYRRVPVARRTRARGSPPMASPARRRVPASQGAGGGRLATEPTRA